MTLKLFWNKFYVSIIFVITCLVLGIVLMCTVVGNDSNYSEVNVDEGDSLWALADQYAGKSDMAKADFVSWVEKENNLTDGHVKAGESVVIPVHETKLLNSDTSIQLANQ
ncbi:cell division suppressor protein YneA [Listeria ivanovii]|uniref:Cell division suppressor protein YneA n=1 Tax=Listeria ivanovii (strain ATCC BAA-678 / PAM 55) TaxID=881621 RepID=G2ZFL8_LISIP|nr:cell division suppressor protein YneA [Listeria ivanovii]AHI55800.1 cell division protein [Listeria ivanovii WSLC3009]AIS65244.1 cell division suppressor protein YneA [Listeria ivanovii subsp. ivanovii]MBC1760096.1 cell division suppressor protein YneA [Listeria ivanovii]MBK3914603.1 cell division suppressor protein YneA [Listeria ivanovii subsp. ivanovii]MBK3921499.1 cell division suppressor protein YneA [Listeria ivanovii subsp. ivanovii]